MITSLCLSLVLQANVTWTGPGDRLERLLPALGAKVGRPWKASPAISGEVLLVHVKDADPDVLQKKIAECTQGEWETANGALVLTRRKSPPVSDAQPNAAEIAKAAIAAAEQGLKAEVTPAKAVELLKAYQRSESPERAAREGYWESMRKLEDVAPQRRLIFKIMRAIGEKQLTKAFEHERAVFVANPNRRQFALPKAIDQFVNQAIREQEAWQTAMQQVQTPEGGTVSMPTARNLDAKHLQHLKLELKNLFGGYRGFVNLWADTTFPSPKVHGQIVGQYSVEASQLFTELAKPPEPGSSNVTFSEEAQAEVDAVTNVFARPADRSMTLEMKARLLDPVAHDPLSGFVSEALAQWADSTKTNVVASVPDRFWNLMASIGTRGSLTIRAIDLAVRDPYSTSVVTTDDGWTTVASPSRGWKDWSDRQAMKDILARPGNGEDLTLDDQATFEFEQSKHASSWPRMYAILLTDTALQPASTAETNGYLLWGSLTKNQRKELRSNKKLPVFGLNAEQKKLVEAIVYANVLGGMVKGEAENTSMIGGEQADPTDVCPDGVPPSAFISFDEKVYPRLMAYNGTSADSVFLRKFDRATAARVMGGPPEEHAQWFGGPVAALGFKVAKETVADLRVVVGEKWWHSFRLLEGIERPKGNPVDWSQIPDEMKKAPDDLREGGD